MKKCLKYISVAFFLFFMGFNINSVEAKNQCGYSYDNTFNGKNSSYADYQGIQNIKFYANSVGIGTNSISDASVGNLAHFEDKKKIDTDNCENYICVAYYVGEDMKNVDTFSTNYIGFNKFYLGKCKESYQEITTGFFSKKTTNYKLYEFKYDQYVEPGSTVTTNVCLNNLAGNDKCMTFSYDKNKGITYDIPDMASKDNNKNINIKVDENSLSQAYNGTLSDFNTALCKITSTIDENIEMLVSFDQSLSNDWEDCTTIKYRDIKKPTKIETVTTTCDDLPKTTKLVKQIYGLIKYLIPVLVIGLSIVDFLKVLLNGDEKVYKEAWSKFVKRLIIGVVILILPIILSFIINLSGALDSYGVDKNNIFCIFS